MEVVPLGPGFAAELHGVDLIDVASSDSAYRRVREAFEEHTVIVFRAQTVSDDVQISFSRAFGPLERANGWFQPTSSVQTLKLTSVFGPKVWVIGTSAASRP